MCFLDACNPFGNIIRDTFDKSLTISAFSFEVFVFLAAGLVIAALYRTGSSRAFYRFFVMLIGLIIFEMFTAPMWHNEHLGMFGYMYRDVSWVLTVGWAALILGVMILIDYFGKNLRETLRFPLYLIGILLLALPFEALLIAIGVRSYSPEVMDVVAGNFLPFFGVPAQALYYIPVFAALVIGFYKYWMFHFEHAPLLPMKKERLARNLFLATVSVLLFELVVEPMVMNVGFPKWSYIYRDISLLLTGFWIVVIWLTTTLVDSFFKHYDLLRRFALYLVFGSFITWPVESLLIRTGYRVYGESATANFSGFVTPLTGVPIEVAFAIPCYLALMIGFIRYWGIILDNRK